MAFARRTERGIRRSRKGRSRFFASSDIAERGFCVGMRHAADLAERNERPRQFRDLRPRLPHGDRADAADCSRQRRAPWLWAALAADNVPLDTWFQEKNIGDVGNRQHPDREI